jgi:hypothetical protein
MRLRPFHRLGTVVAALGLVGLALDARSASAFGCTLECEEVCPNPAQHWAFNGSSRENPSGIGPHSCEVSNFDSCNGSHPLCLFAYEAVADSLRFAIVTGDTNAATGLVTRHPEKLVINSERSALQVRGCKVGSVSAHIPVSYEILRAAERASEGLSARRSVSVSLR